jgi:hypothetical protein
MTGKGSSPIQGAFHTHPAAIQNMRIYHGRADIAVPEQFLHRANVVSVFQQVCREAVSKRMAVARLGNPGTANRTCPSPKLIRSALHSSVTFR